MKRRALKLSASDQLRLQHAKLTGEYIGCWLLLEHYTQPWWKWTIRLAIAIALTKGSARPL